MLFSSLASRISYVIRNFAFCWLLRVYCYIMLSETFCRDWRLRLTSLHIFAGSSHFGFLCFCCLEITIFFYYLFLSHMIVIVDSSVFCDSIFHHIHSIKHYLFISQQSSVLQNYCCFILKFIVSFDFTLPSRSRSNLQTMNLIIISLLYMLSELLSIYFLC